MEYDEEDVWGRHGNVRLIQWMVHENFLRDLRLCPRCDGNMNLERSTLFKKDKYCWKCSNSRCKLRRSVRGGSFFEDSRLSLRKLILIVINFAAGSAAYNTANRLGINRKSVGRVYKEMRARWRQDLARDPISFTNGFEFEVDELFLHHIRRDDGTHGTQWIMGILERVTGKVIYFRIPDRSALTMIPPIIAGVPNGSFVYTDDWSSYSSLVGLPYYHHSVNHSAGEYQRWDQVGNFWLNVHINTLEGVNGVVRLKFHNKQNITFQRIDMYLDEIMYRRSGRSLFDPIKIFH
jgi:ISXO2-like transposase domain